MWVCINVHQDLIVCLLAIEIKFNSFSWLKLEIYIEILDLKKTLF